MNTKMDPIISKLQIYNKLCWKEPHLQMSVLYPEFLRVLSLGYCCFLPSGYTSLDTGLFADDS